MNDNINLPEVDISHKSHDKDAAKQIKNVGGKAINVAGKGIQVSGKAVNVAGKGTQTTGKGVKTVGKGASAAGKGVFKAGTALSSTGLGAIVGVPLMALGAAATVAGEAGKVAGSGAEVAGKGTSKVGKGIGKLGGKISRAGSKISESAESSPTTISEGSEEEAKVVKRIFSALLFIAIKFFLIFIVLLVLVIIMVCIMIAPLVALGILDEDEVVQGITDAAFSGVSAIFVPTDNSNVYFPIGGSEVVADASGNEYAVGDPATTEITATFAGNDDVHNGNHGGIDISAGVNEVNVIAVLDGVVIYPTESDRVDYPNGYYCSGDGQGYGNFVMIDHGNGLKTIYGHMYENTITVRAGDVVKRGQVIGRTGTSGCSTGGHLHFEMRLGDEKVDPFEYISTTNPRGKDNSVTLK